MGVLRQPDHDFFYTVEKENVLSVCIKTWVTDDLTAYTHTHTRASIPHYAVLFLCWLSYELFIMCLSSGVTWWHVQLNYVHSMKPESGNRSNQQPEEGDKDQRDMPAKDLRVLKKSFLHSSCQFFQSLQAIRCSTLRQPPGGSLWQQGAGSRGWTTHWVYYTKGVLVFLHVIKTKQSSAVSELPVFPFFDTFGQWMDKCLCRAKWLSGCYVLMR